ncbi:unnamed protein product [Symbiodinium natans]|uniref:Uncharacterized protein n=1 Tax=Symbiodinium natans TaxID=878477 RepID=A0A812N728_9DINO|nr:unnamed protein product [Symbiodinium natans]
MQSLASLPNVLLSALIAPESMHARHATQDAVATLLELAFRSTELQIQRRAARAVQRLLDDEGEPWQLRWRYAQALRFFSRVVQEEGKVDSPDFQAFVASAEAEKA